MRTTATIFLFLLLFPVLCIAQDKLFTIEDATGLNRSLYPARLSQLQWCGHANTFAWVANDHLILSDAKKGMADTLLSLDQLNNALGLQESNKLKRFPRITCEAAGQFRFLHEGAILRFDLTTGTHTTINTFSPKGENLEISPEKLHAAYTIDHTIFISVNQKEKQITFDGKEGIVYGTSVHRNEFGISKGFFWSPQEDYLAFYRMDESMVTEYPLVDVNSRVAEISHTRYPMAGMTSHEVTIGICHLETGSVTYLQTGEPVDQYLTNITWSPDEEFIYVAVLNRDQNHMKLNQYRVADGSFVKTLFEERSMAYVEPQNGLFFLPGDPTRFVWMSNRDGFTHLYLYQTDGTLIRQLTHGHWEVLSFTGFDPTGRAAWFMGNAQDPMGSYLYKITLKKGDPECLTPASGSHQDLVSADGSYILDTYSGLTIPSTTELLDKDGHGIRVLSEPGNPLAGYALGETAVFPLKSATGDDLYCRLIKPVGFDSTRSYPVFLYVYGGPHSQLVTNSWLGGANFFMQYLAQQGYIVFTLDNHGTANRGRDFEQAIFRNLGTLEMEDQMTGVEYLKSKPWIDSNRIGINGWSYGGFMALTMALRNPGVFKVVVAGGPVIDWKYYEVMYGERYMDTPESNPEGYEKACLLKYVDSITGDILIIQGYQDETVVPQNSLSFLNACIKAGKQVDFFLYPNHPHNVGGKDRMHLNTMIVDYFNEHLE